MLAPLAPSLHIQERTRPERLRNLAFLAGTHNLKRMVSTPSLDEALYYNAVSEVVIFCAPTLSVIVKSIATKKIVSPGEPRTVVFEGFSSPHWITCAE